MKQFLNYLLGVLFVAALIALFLQYLALTKAREEIRTLSGRRDSSAEDRSERRPSEPQFGNEISRLDLQKEELLRLRNEVRQLRDQKAQMEKLRLENEDLRDAIVFQKESTQAGWSNLVSGARSNGIRSASVSLLIQALTNESPGVRLESTKVLRQIGLQRLLDTNLTAEVDAELRTWAKAAVPGLVQSLKDPDTFVRANAAITLGSLREDPQTVVPALVRPKALAADRATRPSGSCKVSRQEPETQNSKPETLNSQLSPPSPRNGKIARLPDDIRFRVSQMIRSGRSYSDVSDKLAELGHPGISPANISNWKYGGFVDWLTEEQRSDRRLVFAQALDRCTRSADIDRIQQNTIALAADKLAHIILDFDHERALALLTHQPELFPKFLAAIGTLSKSTVDLAKAFDLAQNREATIRSRSADIPVRTIAETSTENGDSTPDSAEQPNGPAPAPGLPRAEPLIEPTEVKNTALDFNRFKPILSDFSRFDTKPEHGKLKELQIDTL